jgi:hypothetical protein
MEICSCNRYRLVVDCPPILGIARTPAGCGRDPLVGSPLSFIHNQHR